MTMTENSIQLTDINAELTRLWDTEQGQNKVRASLFNLILYVQKNKRAEHYKNLVKSVVSKFPCRVILILSDPDPKESYLRTSVSTETIGEGELQIFCEMIQIDVAGSLVQRVPFIILPQILPDLPVYLLWTQDPSTESAILPHLEPIANRIIFDSESTYDLQAYSRGVLSLTHRFHCQIGDLNWSVLSGWRQIISGVFDTPECLLSLVQTKIMRIYYNKLSTEEHRHAECEAAYLQAWVASRLNWKFQMLENNEGNIRLTYSRPTSQAVVLLVPQEVSELPSGTILSVEIESMRNKDHYSFKRHPNTRQVFIQHSDHDCCDLPYCSYLLGHEEGQEIIDEIFYPSGGRHYQEMLEILTMTPWRTQ